MERIVLRGVVSPWSESLFTGKMSSLEPPSTSPSFKFRTIGSGSNKVIKVDIPGCGSEDVNISVSRATLDSSQREEPCGFLSISIEGKNYGKKIIPLDPNTDIEKISAAVEKGILTISIPDKNVSRSIPVS